MLTLAIARLLATAEEVRRACECGRIRLGLQVPLEDVPVARAHDDRAEREDDGQEKREEDDDLAALPSARRIRALSMSPPPPRDSTAPARAASWRSP